MSPSVYASARRRIDCHIGVLGDQFCLGKVWLPESTSRSAMVSGFSIHGNVSIDARDRDRLECLIRYAARPAISTERLSELPDGRLLYESLGFHDTNELRLPLPPP